MACHESRERSMLSESEVLPMMSAIAEGPELGPELRDAADGRKGLLEEAPEEAPEARAPRAEGELSDPGLPLGPRGGGQTRLPGLGSRTAIATSLVLIATAGLLYGLAADSRALRHEPQRGEVVEQQVSDEIDGLSDSEPGGYDCQAGIGEWGGGWSEAKKSQCCLRAGRGCESYSGAALHRLRGYAGYHHGPWAGAGLLLVLLGSLSLVVAAVCCLRKRGRDTRLPVFWKEAHGI